MKGPCDGFGRLLRELRKKYGWTADRLSREVGLAKTYLGRWEREAFRKPKAEVLAAAAAKMGLSAAEERELFRLARLRCIPDAIRDRNRDRDGEDAGADPVMPWWEKAKRIIQERRRTYGDVEADAGWAPETLKDALGQRRNITIRKAMGLARALSVPSDWLFDPTQPWEARPQPPESAPDDAMSRLCRALTQGYAAFKELTADTKTDDGK